LLAAIRISVHGGGGFHSHTPAKKKALSRPNRGGDLLSEWGGHYHHWQAP